VTVERQNKPKADRPRAIGRRATLDAIGIGGIAVLLAALAPDGHAALLSSVAAIGVGILVFVVRRNADLAQVLEARAAARAALAGKGLSLADWHGGVALPPWPERVAPGAPPAAPSSEKRLAQSPLIR
jgi:hypothetical protein